MAKKARNVKEYNNEETNYFELKKVFPKTVNQELIFREYEKGKHLFLHGFPGTGKTYLAFYLALKELLTGSSGYDRIIIVRSVVPSRDMGFLPGTAAEKAKIYEAPYKAIGDEIFGRGNGYNTLRLKKLVEFETTSFLRGITFDRSIIIVDEVQNMTFQELQTIMTRVGNHSKILFAGDFRQSDLIKKSDKTGLIHFMEIMKRIPDISFIELNEHDIVRSAMVKAFIIAEMKYRDLHTF